MTGGARRRPPATSASSKACSCRYREALSDISVTDAAKRLGVGRVALSRLLNGATGIGPEMALRLSKALGTLPEFWYGMQINHELWQAKKKFRVKSRPIVQRDSAAA
ncbi:MAG: HigA family addiction module antidote protein [Sinobacteraceae bacterium]|nr:HigA family addiction module antidote protein [Nevskiaceae bacterium]